MSLWKIAWRSIQQRSLASTLTAISMALGVTLVVAVLVAGHAINQSFNSGSGLGYNLVIGKKGSPLQLVLNTVYYLDRPIENIPWSYYKEFLTADQRGDGVDGRFASLVETAVPCALGDYYAGFRVVGTTPAMFGALELRPGVKFSFAAGENFLHDKPFAGVIGATVAEATGLRVGDGFQPTHSAPEGGHVHEEKFTITGILDRTGTPLDRALFVNLEGFYRINDHAAKPTVPLTPTVAPSSAGVVSKTSLPSSPPSTAPSSSPDPKEPDAHDDHSHADKSATKHDHADHDHAREGHAHEEADQAKEKSAAPHSDHDHADHDHDHADPHKSGEKSKSDPPAKPDSATTDNTPNKLDHADHDHDHSVHATDKSAATPGAHDHSDHDHADHDHAHEDQTVASPTAKQGPKQDQSTPAPASKSSQSHDDHDHDDHDHDHPEQPTKGGAKDHDHENDHAHDHSGHDHGDHDHDHSAPVPENLREVTAVLVLTKSVEGLPELGADNLIRPINKDVVAQAVMPIYEISKFLETFLKPLRLVLLVLTILIVVVSAISIMVSIYNSLAERRHEIAVMRALGAGRATVLRILLLESILLALIGGVFGWLLGHLALNLLSPYVTREAGVSLSALQFSPGELWLIPGIIALASLVGFLPAWSAYRTDVAKALTSSP